MSPLSGYLHSFRMTNGCQRFHAASSPPRVAAASLGLNCEAAGEVAITSLNGERGIQFKPLSEVGSVLKGSRERAFCSRFGFRNEILWRPAGYRVRFPLSSPSHMRDQAQRRRLDGHSPGWSKWI